MNTSIRKFFYGDIPEDRAGSNELKSAEVPPLGGGGGSSELNNPQVPPLGGGGGGGGAWPLWEIFIRSKQGLDHKHVGSLHAADAQMAIENARDVYTRRQEGVSIWVVESKFITATNPDEAGELYEPAMDKIYRYPTFYELPEEVNHM